MESDKLDLNQMEDNLEDEKQNDTYSKRTNKSKSKLTIYKSNVRLSFKECKSFT